MQSKRVKGDTVIEESNKGKGKPSKADGKGAVGKAGRKPGTNELVKVKRQQFKEMGSGQQFQQVREIEQDQE